MQPFPAVKRPGGAEIDGHKRDCYDLRRPWKDGHTGAGTGMVYASFVTVALVTLPPPDKPVKARVWVGHRPPVDVVIDWIDGYAVAVPEFARVSVVPLDDKVELDVWWELTAGKA